MSLRTPRLQLEPLGPDHAQGLLDYEIRNRAHLRRWEPARDDVYYTIDAMRQQLEIDVARMREQTIMRFAAFWTSPEVVAVVNLWQIRRGVDHSAIIGYSVDEAHQSQGIATEAVAFTPVTSRKTSAAPES